MNQNEDDSNDSGFIQQSNLNEFEGNQDQFTDTDDPTLISYLYRQYDPMLKENQNPIYYEINRILFEAHQMRLMRNHNHDHNHSHQYNNHSTHTLRQEQYHNR